MKIKIGVLGGIGPEATREFYSILINIIQQKGIKNNTDFPQIIINSIPAPELIYNKISEKDLKPYIDGLKELDIFGVDFIVMVCNTIHLFYEKLQKEIGTEILNLRKEVKDFLIRKGIKSYTVLGTPNTIRNDLYSFENMKEMKIINEDIEKLSSAIFNFNKGCKKEEQKRTVKNIVQKYIEMGSEVIILGCTELALMMKDLDISKIDTIEVLAEATARKFFEFKERGTK